MIDDVGEVLNRRLAAADAAGCREVYVPATDTPDDGRVLVASCCTLRRSFSRFTVNDRDFSSSAFVFERFSVKESSCR